VFADLRSIALILALHCSGCSNLRKNWRRAESNRIVYLEIWEISQGKIECPPRYAKTANGIKNSWNSSGVNTRVAFGFGMSVIQSDEYSIDTLNHNIFFYSFNSLA